MTGNGECESLKSFYIRQSAAKTL